MFFTRKESPVITDAARIDEVLERGVAEVIVKDELRETLLSGRRLRIKFGIDPTSPHIHLGSAVSYLKLRDFQELGHTAVVIVGDATGVVGDTSDKDSERPMLSRKQIAENKKTYLKQIGKLIDLSRAEVKYNSAWLDTLTYTDIGEQANQFSVADFIARENIKRRLDAGKRVSLREVLYPLMQGYDSVAVHADVELGGTDQRFNLLAGRTLQEHYGQKPQHLVMMNLIAGTDGNKMSKSAANTINLTDTPGDMYGKVMRVDDELIETYFVHTTRLPMDDIKTILAAEKPRDAKMRLAREVVTLHHDAAAAAAAEADFVAAFSKGNVPGSINETSVVRGTALVDVLLKTGLVESRSEFRRLTNAGAVTDMDTKQKVTDATATVEKSLTLKVGKRRFIKIAVTK